MVKGITRRVVVIKSPDQNIFDEAVFIVREDALHRGVTNSEILREAQDAAASYMKSRRKKGVLSDLPAPHFAVLGAAATGLLWLLSHIL